MKDMLKRSGWKLPVFLLAAGCFFMISAFSMLIHYLYKNKPVLYSAVSVLESALMTRMPCVSSRTTRTMRSTESCTLV